MRPRYEIRSLYTASAIVAALWLMLVPTVLAAPVTESSGPPSPFATSIVPDALPPTSETLPEPDPTDHGLLTVEVPSFELPDKITDLYNNSTQTLAVVEEKQQSTSALLDQELVPPPLELTKTRFLQQYETRLPGAYTPTSDKAGTNGTLTDFLHKTSDNANPPTTELETEYTASVRGALENTGQIRLDAASSEDSTPTITVEQVEVPEELRNFANVVRDVMSDVHATLGDVRDSLLPGYIMETPSRDALENFQGSGNSREEHGELADAFLKSVHEFIGMIRQYYWIILLMSFMGLGALWVARH